jgi:hypothetical protein
LVGIVSGKSHSYIDSSAAALVGEEVERFAPVVERRLGRGPTHELADLAIVGGDIKALKYPAEPINSWAGIPHFGHRGVF